MWTTGILPVNRRWQERWAYQASRWISITSTVTEKCLSRVFEVLSASQKDHICVHCVHYAHCVHFLLRLIRQIKEEIWAMTLYGIMKLRWCMRSPQQQNDVAWWLISLQFQVQIRSPDPTESQQLYKFEVKVLFNLVQASCRVFSFKSTFKDCSIYSW